MERDTEIEILKTTIKPTDDEVDAVFATSMNDVDDVKEDDDEQRDEFTGGLRDDHD